jgi:hypothetical protein
LTDGRRADLEAALSQVEARLAARFGHVDRATIRAVVRSSSEAFADVHVTHFVPVLVERRSVARLKGIAAPVAT